MKKVTNNLVELNPKLAKEWDYVKNIKHPEEYVPGSGIKVSWICNKKHKWDATIRSRSHQNTGCPYCKGRLPTKENNLKKKFPNIAKEWDYEKNDKGPEEYLPSTNHKVWWKCRKKHSFQQVIYSRTLQNLSCPYCSGKKVGYGNDLKTNFPELAKEWDYEKNDKGPEEYLPSTYHKVWWLCPKKHSYQSSISNRNKKNAKGTSCPYCSIPAKKVGYGNDLKTNFPAVTNFWDYEKNDNGPEKFLAGSGKKVWFLCPKKHSYNQSIVDFSKGKNCPYCTGHKIGYGNDFQTSNPKLAKEWDYEKNDKGPNEYGPRSDFRAWWLCPKKHSYQSSISNRNKKNAKGTSCPYCSVPPKKIGYGNDLKTNYPELAKEWDYEKNNKGPEEYFPSSNKKVWWKCREDHFYSSIISSRTLQKTNCPFCSNYKAGYGNDLKTNYPELAKEWDYEKNNKGPEEYLPSSNKKVWWKCKEDHSYFAQIQARNKLNTGCPYCSGRKPTKENNLLVLHPDLAKEWDYEKNDKGPEEYTPISGQKVWWICEVGHNWDTKISMRSSKRHNTNCPYCFLTPRSRDEIYLLFELKTFFSIDENDHKILLDKIYDVDIKISDEKLVIEYDGAYWHKEKVEKDKNKTKALQDAGWTVIRIREKPLKILSNKYNVSNKAGEYKQTANLLIIKLKELGFITSNIEKYLSCNNLVNLKSAEKFIKKLIIEKNKS